MDFQPTERQAYWRDRVKNFIEDHVRPAVPTYKQQDAEGDRWKVIPVVEELKAVFDPRGGTWMKGRYVPSLLAAIGEVIEQHMIDTGFIAAKDGKPVTEALRAVAGDPPPHDGPAVTALKGCPRCGERGMVRQEGCETCTSCGYSKCS